MSTHSAANACWHPVTEADRKLVLAAMHSILESQYFRNSKRYPAFLEYVVTKTIEGDTSHIKERTLGVEVFDRRPDYDTNEDPVVRFTAGAVRRKIAQYYQEHDHGTAVYIELPLGSYVPRFHIRPVEQTTALEPEIAGPSDHISIHTHDVADQPLTGERIPSSAEHLNRWIGLCAGLLLMSVLGWLLLVRGHRASVVDRVWAPLFQSPADVLVILGDSHPELGVEPPTTSIHDHLIGPYQHVSLSSATSMARICGLLNVHGKRFEIREDPIPTFADLRSRPVVLIGGMNNSWSLRLNDNLPFRLHNGPVAEIVDSQNPGNHDWQLDFSKPFSSIATDYAVVARYQDAATDGPVVIVAGLGPYGTETAAEFVVSPRFLTDLAEKLPSGWEKHNFEVVLKTNVIKGSSGPPNIVATRTW